MRSRFLNSTAQLSWLSVSRLKRPSPWVCRGCQVQLSRFRGYSSQTPPVKPFYVTTPIFYVNAAPHVGHLYSMVVTDILKRFQQVKGRKAIMCTGTDEHGMKVQRAAEKAGIKPKDFCDKGAEIFKDLAAKALIKNDHFVRTTDQEHKDAVEYSWLLLKEKGLIYKKKHEGWYSVTDEAFYPESAVQLYLDPATGRKYMTSIETGSEVEWSSEENYHFRLSAFRDPLLQFFKENPDWITPEHRMKEVVSDVSSSLSDLSISRPYSRLSWGIRVPDDPTQTIYVWLDALINYLTKAGYPTWTPGTEAAGGWPADFHVIGKDIVRFHCIYWPAFLMALDLPLPKHILTHGHWTLGGKKMSKSTGTVVNPFQALERFGPDIMRFFLAHDGAVQDDAQYDNLRILEVYNKFLRGAFGNLAARVIKSNKWSVRGAVERVGGQIAEICEEGPGSKFYKNHLLRITPQVDAAFERGEFRRGVLDVSAFVHATNQFFQMSEPWKKTLYYEKGNPGLDVDRTIFLATEALRMSAILLQPTMPNKCALLLDQLGVDESRRTIEYCRPGADLEYGIPKGDTERVLFPIIEELHR
ncbi:methionyl-tRNA synthetase-like protein [Delitschia confertaspora ATCC 74209]|uniref:Probable methionine--tRNA ligase, mitochondrial n=1 Tax=Delitschia confertaspora ATCC 74209 TaxID=1513339 RepID=A0A9P4MPA8_9PLEO|nr:methionyl-tRNA synthetase-like protein [Delitschia confertaspora ATCC 74209]